MRNGDYELVIAPADYPGRKYRGRYCYEHHLVWWRHYGSILRNNDVIHHINGNRRDNHIENLELVSRTAHSSGHRKGTPMVSLSCAYCGEEFQREARIVRFRVKSGQRDFYCSRSCMGSAFGNGRPKTLAGSLRAK